MENKKLREAIHVLLTLVTAVFIITGIGFSENRLIERLTLGLLTKERSLLIHTNLIEVFMILLFLHVYLKIRQKYQSS